jgi:Ca2+-binding RTX toxin-like protein
MTRKLPTTPRAVISLIFLWALLAFGLSAQAQRVADEDLVYLYYFESDDANLKEAKFKDYAFSTLSGERVTIVVYGLDQLVRPKLTIFNDAGVQVGQGSYAEEQPYATAFSFLASSNQFYTFRVERLEGPGGLARVMIFEGEPLNQDLTLLDDMNPLLPSRSFMVAGRDTEEGLRVLVEVLDVPYTNEKPQVFASRGTLEEIPPVEERFSPSDTFLWFNRDGKKVYFVNIRPTPEETTPASENLPLRIFNVGRFFYFDYYFTVGAGSDPVRLIDRQECANASNRIECVRNSPTLGRQEDDIRFVPPVEEAPGGITRDELPPILPCVGGTTGITVVLPPPAVPPGILVGTACDDNLTGSPVDDVIAGGPGNDQIFGEAGNDQLYGDDGNDILDGGIGNDFLYGGTGNDVLIGGPGNDFLYGEAGIDQVDYSSAPGGVTVDLTNTNLPTGGTATGAAGNDRIFSVENIQGSSFNDLLTGSSGDNVINGGAGDDTINGNGGNDLLLGGAGNDQFDITTNGNAFISGGNFASDPASGNDTFMFYDGAGGVITLNDWYGDDVIDFSNVSQGVTFFLWNTFAQNPYGSLIIDLVFDDINGLIGTDFDDVLAGSDGLWKNCDYVDAGAGNDLVYATQSNSPFCASHGSALTNDVLVGGAGNDTLSYERVASVNVDLAAGTSVKAGGQQDDISGFENVIGSNGADTILGDGGANTLIGLSGNDSIDGRAGDDFIDGGQGDDTLLGGVGNDTVLGGLGNDIIDGGSGNNSLEGNDGNDTITAGVGDDTILGGAGNDIINAGGGNNSVDGGSEDDSIITGAGDDTILGGTGNDTITTTGGDNSIDGGIGNDSITTGVGDDTILGDAGNDIINAGGGNNSVDGGADDDSITTGAGDDTIFGGTGNDTITTTGGDNSIDGGSGNDSISTGTGDDTIFGGAGNDTIATTGGDNSIDGGADDDSITTGAGNDSILGGAGNDFISAGDGDNTVDGGSGNDQIITGIGDDIIVGGAGNDFMNAGGGNDLFTENTATEGGADTYDGGIGVDSLVYTSTNNMFGFFSGALNLLNDGTGVDSLNSIEFLTTGSGNDSLYLGNTMITNLETGIGNDTVTLALGVGANTVNMGDGDDVLNVLDNLVANIVDGGTGSNTLNYGAGNDVLSIGAGGLITSPDGDQLTNFQTVNTGNGADSLTMSVDDGSVTSINLSGGNDTYTVLDDSSPTLVDGGADFDLADYTGMTTGLNLTLGSSVVGVGDTLVNFEALLLTNQDDVVTVNSDTTITTLSTNGGNDEVIFNDGAVAMTVDGGAGVNTATFGAGDQTFQLNAGVVTTSDNDTLTNFSVINAGGGNDTFVNVTDDAIVTDINLGDGDDIYQVFSDANPTTVDGGNGFDVADYSFMTGGVTVTLSGSVSGVGDTLINFEDLLLTNFSDTIIVDPGNTIATLTTGNEAGLGDTVIVNADTLTSIITGDGDDIVTFNDVGNTAAESTTVDMGAGVDSISYGTTTANLSIVLGAGGASVTNGAAVDTVINYEVFTAGAGDDTIDVTAAQGSVFAGAGDDSVTLNASVTDIYGDAGDDTFDVISGSGVAYGGDDNDTFNVAAGADYTLYGEAGDDTFNIAWDAAADFFYGGAAGADLADYSANTDDFTVTIGAASTTLTVGAAPADTLTDFEILSLGAGADTVNVTDANSMTTVNLGGGDDSVLVSAFNTGITFDGGAGVNTVTYDNATDDALTVVLGAVSTIGSDSYTNIQIVALDNGADNVTVDAGNTVTTLTTNGGADVVTVNDAGDMTSLNTGDDNDSVTATWDTTDTAFNGAAGVDTLVVDASASSSDFTVDADASGMTITDGTNTDTATNFEDTTVTTGGGNDVFNIDLGTLSGTWTFSAGGSTTGNAFNFTGNAGANLNTLTIYINTASAGADTLNFSGVTGTAGVSNNNGDPLNYSIGSIQIWLNTVVANVIGTNNDDQLVGGSGNDNIDGGGGNDLLVGGAGNDTLNGGSGSDTLVGGFLLTNGGTAGTSGTDSLVGGTGNDLVIGGNYVQCLGPVTTGNGGADGSDTIDAGAGDDTVQGDNLVSGCATATEGTGGADTIFGGPGNDVLNGQAGNDYIAGGSSNVGGTVTDGSDTIDGGVGVDTMIGGNVNDGATAVGNDGADSFIANPGDGNDQIVGDNVNLNGSSGAASGADTINSNGSDTVQPDNTTTNP